MSEFRLNVIAETQKAERSLKNVESVADKATRTRTLNINTKSVSKNFSNLGEDINNATNNIKQFYSVSKQFPVVGGAIKGAEDKVRSLAKTTSELAISAPQAAAGLADSARAGNIISRSFKTAAGTTGTLINRLAKLGFAIFAIQEGANVLKTAFGGLFNETIGRAARFQQTLLKTQTTLASTSKVLVDGVEITDPLEKINALQAEIEDRVDSIRIRSIDLAGVTSNDVVEVFGIVASQVSQINGDLEDAENLAIQFSAALGTFGLPLVQARQEIGSIFRGDVGPDSYLAKSLGITNEDIAKAKASTEGVVGFLEDRLAAAVAGQAISAKGLEGVLSNIRDISELIGQALGEPLLDPLIAASSAFYDILFDSKEILQDIGKGIGKIGSAIGSSFAGAFTTKESPVDLSILSTIQAKAGVVFETLKRDVDGLQRTFAAFVTGLGNAIRTLVGTFAAFGKEVLSTFRELVDAFIQLQLVSLESLISAVATLSRGLVPIVKVIGELLRAWADILRLPIVQYFTQIATTFAVLKATGVLAVAAIVTQLIIWGTNLTAISAKLKALGGVVTGVIKTISTALGSLLLLLGQAAASLKAVLASSGADPKILKQLNVLETEFNKVGRNAKGVAFNFRNLGTSLKTLGRAFGSFALNIVKANVVLLAVTAGITLLVDAFGRLKRAQEEARQAERDAAVIKNYTDNIQGLNRELSLAEEKAKNAALALAENNYDDATAKVQELEAEIRRLNATLETTAGGRSAEGSRRAARRDLAKAEKDLADQREKQSKALSILEQDAAKKRVEVEAQNRNNLEKQIGELRRQIDSDLFNKRQQLARKEVDIFRAAGELRIQQIQKANAKLIEGEEGASRAALEALNTYITTRENGELAIEAAKKDLAIEAANLGKAASDYRFNIEKKIAELRKKSADYEKNSADQRLNALNGATAPLLKLLGDTESFGGNYGAYNRGGTNRGRTAIEPGIDPNLVNLSISEIQRRQTQNVPKDQELFAVGKYQITPDTLKGLLSGQYGDTGVTADDKFTPENQDKLFKALLRNRIVAGDVQATIKGLRQEWIGLQKVADSALRDAVKPLVSPVTVPAAPPTSGANSEIPDANVAADNFNKATASYIEAANKAQSIQAQLTSARTTEAFEQVAKALFPQAALEQYQDRLIELGLRYEALGKSADLAFDPERSAIEVERLTQIAVKARELAETQKGITKNQNINEEERNRLFTEFANKYKVFLADVEKESNFKQSILATGRAVQFATEAQESIKNIKQEIEVIRLRNRLITEGVSPEFIDAEVRKLEISRQIESITGVLNEQLAKQLDLRTQIAQQISGAEGPELEKLQADLEASQNEITRLKNLLRGTRGAGADLAAAQDERAAALTAPGQRINSFIAQAKKELEDYEGLAIRVSQSVGDAIGNSITSGITGLIEGTTTVKDVFSNLLKDIGNILLKESVKIISTYIAIGVAKKFAGLFGGGKVGGDAGNFLQGVNNPLKIADSSGFNLGGFFADGGRPPINKTSIVGERGPELFVPFQQGTIVSNEDLQEQMAKAGLPSMERSSSNSFRETRDSSSSRFRETREVMVPFTRSAEQLSVASAERETAQAISNPGPLDVRFESQVINNVEYVTADQYRKGMSQAAERGRALTLEALQNSVKARKRIGL